MIDHIHELNIVCILCVRDRCIDRDKLLTFVKQLAHESVYERYENLNEMNWAANDLLREIWESE